MNGMTFAAADVTPETSPLPTFDSDASVRSLLVSRVEAMFRYKRPFVGRTDLHPLAQAAYLAYVHRYPIELSPDAIWLCLARGVALHIGAKDDLRRQILQDDHEFELTVAGQEFTLGQENPWPLVFPSFAQQIAARVGGLTEVLTAGFSATGPVERLAAELTVTGPFAPYFAWEPPFPGDQVYPDRGIPAVVLHGTADDWRLVRRRTSMFGSLGLENWSDAVLPVLDQLIASAEGRPDPRFWRAFFRYENGADELTGWIHVLFPYLRAWPSDAFVPNPHLADWHARWEAAEARDNPLAALGDPQGPGLGELPPGLSSTRLCFVDTQRRERPLELITGLIGVTQDPRSLALAPEFLWAIVHPDAEPAQ
jgi:hypothetical protein